MSEKLTFHFEGALADEHRMNFYESARFQYAAARLLVKLSQFRNAGKFNKKISSKSNFDVRLASQSDGSFNINVEDAGRGKSEDQFVDVSLGDLVAYVSERVIEKIDEDSLKDAGMIGRQTDADQAQSQVDEIAESVNLGDTTLDAVPVKIRDVIKRRLAEVSREERMNDNSDAIKKIDFARSQKLIAMSAPLIGEMATALRRSADTLEVSSSISGSAKPVLFLDQNMAAEIETSIVDKEITALLCDVVQFNKDNGWGKVRIENGAVTVSFSIPYDILPRIKQTLIDTMKKDQVYLQTYFVRDRAGEVIRLIVAGILPTPAN
ncbi:hypothetical protein [Sulfitobacter sabulilitoris]|uniref:Uncharacterized protein n=1 Tax=Sulfitobacter sabulilitoris TaxID=2562655 RepID=A0A5S3PCV0_9RHOB|nr:hypothetical protein [Sulfitobacter sabulilitoris]TMM51689.1 hypothetical protein FDT80_13100 [Sulfitobacter sabulilitoris]